MRSVIVEVKREDIDAGVRNDCDKCPVALAINRALNVNNVAVYEEGMLDMYVVGYSGWLIPLPISARDFIVGFDLGHGVDPFSFELVLE